jgi:hypothetical protein
MRVVLGHEIKRSRKTAAEPMGVGFKGTNELTFRRSLKRLALPSEGKGHTFESCRVRHFPLILPSDMRTRIEASALPR